VTVSANNEIKNNYMDFKYLLAFKKLFGLAMKIFELSKFFPKEEKHSLTDHCQLKLKTEQQQ